jgi:hypothetical protein
MSLSKQEFTDAGRSMLGRAQNGATLTITKIVVGSGTAAQPSDLWPLTALIAQEMNVTISAKRDYGQGTLLVEGSFTSPQAPHAFSMREVGIMAHIASEADRLYSVANCFTDAPIPIDPASPTVETFKIKLIVDRIPTANIVVQIGPSENVIGSNIGPDTVGAGVYKDAAGNVLNFKRLVQGANMDIHEAADENSIYIGMKVLPNNLDLYVPLTYPGISDPNVLFPTIQAAHDYLLSFMIPTDKYATIHVAAGSFTGRLNLWHPNGSQIALVGWPRQDRPATAINYVNATSKKVNVATPNDFTVNQPVWLMTALGWTGGSYIVAKGASDVTLHTYDRGGRTPYTIAVGAAQGARISWCPTVLVSPDQPPWTGDEVLCNCNYGSVTNLTLVGGYRCLALSSTRCAIGNIYALNGAVGIAGGPFVVLNGGTDIVVTECGFGLSIGTVLNGIGGSPRSVDFCANSCDCGIAVGGNGALGAVPGVGSATGVIYLNNNGEGVRGWGNTLSIGNVVFSKNDTGFDSAYCGTLIFGPFVNYPYDNRVDLYAHGMGFIEYYKGAGAEPICNPVKNTTGNANAYIHVP